MTLRRERRGRRLAPVVLGAVFAITAGWWPALGADHPFSARFDWRTDGEIHQVMFHREFNGLFRETKPLAVDAGPEISRLFDGVVVQCEATAKVGLPNWSVTTGTCSLVLPAGDVLVVAINCRGTQKLCDGRWEVSEGSGAFAGVAGGGTLAGVLVEPDPLPWFWDGPLVGYNELRGTISLP